MSSKSSIVYWSFGDVVVGFVFVASVVGVAGVLSVLPATIGGFGLELEFMEMLTSEVGVECCW